jgi:hypothetical protein
MIHDRDSKFSAAFDDVFRRDGCPSLLISGLLGAVRGSEGLHRADHGALAPVLPHTREATPGRPMVPQLIGRSPEASLSAPSGS